MAATKKTYRKVARIPARAEELAHFHRVGISTSDWRWVSEVLHRLGDRFFLSTTYGIHEGPYFPGGSGRYLLTKEVAQCWWKRRKSMDVREREAWLAGEYAFDSYEFDIVEMFSTEGL